LLDSSLIRLHATFGAGLAEIRFIVNGKCFCRLLDPLELFAQVAA